VAGDRNELILVDGSGYVFRAFHALPPLNNSHGLPTNASYGFIRMLVKLLKDARPTHIAVVFDSAKKTFRDDLFAEYKQNRPPAPSDLKVQIPYIHRAVDAFRITRIVRDGVEADDVIGTLASRAIAAGLIVTIVTADKDFMQLVGPRMTLWDTMRDRRIGLREVRERFGVEPSALVDIQALTGDPIDNVKGVPGVGEKTASALIKKFGNIRELYAHLDQLDSAGIRGAKKVAELLSQHRADVELALKLVRIDTDVPLDIGPDTLAWPGIDEPAVSELLRELEFTSLLAELAPSQAAARPREAAEMVAVAADELPKIVGELKSAARIAIDFRADASGGDRLQLFGGEKTYILDRGAAAAAAPLLASPLPPKSCHDLKRHLREFHRHGLELAGADFDTMLAGFLINSGKVEPSLDDLYHEHLAPLGQRTAPGTEAELVAGLRDALEPRLKAEGQWELFSTIEIPVAAILARMEEAGIAVDLDALRRASREFATDVARLERECYELAGGGEFNLNSPVQLREILFDKLKLSTKGLKKTKSGFSTDADTLEKLAAAHPMPRKLLEYRALAKLKSTYADALEPLIDRATGRLHTTFHQASVPTGRVSSTDPNLQNIPTRSEAGRRIRSAFVPKPGAVLLSADYSQIDLRVLAHLSGDPTLVDAFRRGEDIHARTATEVLGISPNKVGPEQRRLAKVINFGLIYGMGPQRLAGELGIGLDEASAYIKRYFERLPSVRSFFDETVNHARESGFVTTLYGRRRYLPELNAPQGGSRAQAERIAINTPIQGTAADLLKLAMISLDRNLRERRLNAEMILQVHDELLLEVAEDALDAASEAAREAMETVAELRVPLKIEVKWGPNWAAMGAAR
jgi:DNA polymerase-1